MNMMRQELYANMAQRLQATVEEQGLRYYRKTEVPGITDHHLSGTLQVWAPQTITVVTRKAFMHCEPKGLPDLSTSPPPFVPPKPHFPHHFIMSALNVPQGIGVISRRASASFDCFTVH
jgi:hypothetical protein